MSTADEIEKLNALREQGAISESEYAELKASAIAGTKPMGTKVQGVLDEVSTDAKFWGMLIHLTQFCGYAIPIAGWIVPIILWLVKKDASPDIDRHGRIVANWILTELILAYVFYLLIFVLIGFPLLICLAIAGITFPIIGGIKANDGKVWQYPGSITFFRLD